MHGSSGKAAASADADAAPAIRHPNGGSLKDARNRSPGPSKCHRGRQTSFCKDAVPREPTQRPVSHNSETGVGHWKPAAGSPPLTSSAGPWRACLVLRPAMCAWLATKGGPPTPQKGAAPKLCRCGASNRVPATARGLEAGGRQRLFHPYTTLPQPAPPRW